MSQKRPTTLDIENRLPMEKYQYVNVTFAMANQDVDIRHDLNPIHPDRVVYTVVKQTAPATIYENRISSRRSWQRTHLWLRASQPTSATLLLWLSSDEVDPLQGLLNNETVATPPDLGEDVGDVLGAESSLDSEIVLFKSITGKEIKRPTVAAVLTSGQLISGPGVDLDLTATAPTAGPSVTAGASVSLSASDATIGSAAGTAAGGAVVVTAGNANGKTSGRAAGGAVTITAGNGMLNSAGSGHDGGAINLTAGNCDDSAAGGVNGAITLTGGGGNNIAGGGIALVGGATTGVGPAAGGAITLTSGGTSSSGSSGPITIASPAVTGGLGTSGAVTIQTGNSNTGGTGALALSIGSRLTASANDTLGDNAGAFTITGGAGQSIQNNVTNGTAGIGSTVAIISGVGGTATATSNNSRTLVGGAGGALTITGATGGAGVSSGATDNITGGVGAAVTVAGGTGGTVTGSAGTRTGGAGGDLIFAGGTGGTGATANGAKGSIKIATATDQKIGLWNTAPIVQPTAAGAAATFVANTSGIADDTATFDGYTLGQVVKALRNLGVLA